MKRCKTTTFCKKFLHKKTNADKAQRSRKSTQNSDFVYESNTTNNPAESSTPNDQAESSQTEHPHIPPQQTPTPTPKTKWSRPLQKKYKSNDGTFVEQREQHVFEEKHFDPTTCGPQTYSSTTSPRDIFSLFFDDTIINRLLQELKTGMLIRPRGQIKKRSLEGWKTNRTLDDRLNKTMLLCFFAVHIEMGLRKRSNIKHHWSTSEPNHFISHCGMSRDDFLQIHQELFHATTLDDDALSFIQQKILINNHIGIPLDTYQ